MTWKVSVIALCAIALAALSATGARAADGDLPVTPLQALCTAQGGLFYGTIDYIYVVCDSNINAETTFTEQQLLAAHQLCTKAYDRRFVISGPIGFPSWYCVQRF